MKISFPGKLNKIFRKKRYLGRSIAILATTLLVIWLTFFDSHSLQKRYNWHTESVLLTEQNMALELQIQDLKRQLETDLPDEVIEQLARERYGMRKEGETVYPVEEVR